MSFRGGSNHETHRFLRSRDNSRLERIENGEVTFRYRDNRSQQLRRETVTGVEFMRRFPQHTLPRGCAKVRYYGLWSPACRAQLEQARTLLGPATIAANPAAAVDTVPDSRLTGPEVPVRYPQQFVGSAG